jgi:hypothetical protein
MKFSKINPGAESKYMGPEPSWTNQEEIQNLKVAEIGALNWYNYICDNKQAKTFLLEYMASVGRTKDEIAMVSSSDKSIPVQLGWIARMMCMGYQPSPSFKEFFVREFKLILDSSKKQKRVKVADVAEVTYAGPSIQDRIREKASEEIGDIEGLVDEFIESGCKTNIDFQSYFKSKNLSSVVLKRMCEFFIRRSKEFEEVMNSKDADIKEGYSNFSKVQLRKVKEIYDSLVAETNRVAEVNKPARKKRKVKEKPASVLAAKVQYMQEFSELGLKSVLPEKIIGANQVWLYNTKTKLLGMYNSDNAKGLTIKGTTIQNYNEQSSSGKRLRKPEVALKEVLNGGKIVLKKLLDGLTTKPSVLTGRINSDTIIVRVITG